MGYLDRLKLPDLDEARRLRPVQQKHAIPTRAAEKTSAEKKDVAALERWRGQVFRRDKLICRHCGRRVERTLTLKETQAQAHHVVSRSDAAVRYDVRNGITLCADPCHRRVTGMVNDKLQIVGTRWFRLAGVKYIDASQPVRFKEMK